MANWIIRENAPSATIEQKRVVLKSRRRVSIKSGDELVLLSREAVFVNKAQVLGVTEASAPSIAPFEESEPKQWGENQIDEWTSLQQEIDLNDASTSLTFIRNWRRPKVHVRPAYRRLPDEDFATLERGELFVARDAYLTFLDALPARLVQAFLAENPPFLRTRYTTEYAERARALISFIEERVLSVGRTALAVQDRWNLFLAKTDSGASRHLYVWNEDEASWPIDFTAQVAAFRTLLPENGAEADSGGSSQLTEIAEILASRQGIESRFENLFRNRVGE
jgi:hypothetical protein